MTKQILTKGKSLYILISSPHILHTCMAHQTWRHASSGGEGELSFIPLNISPIYIHAHIKMKTKGTKEIKKSLVDI